jgi:hypothetical protein
MVTFRNVWKNTAAKIAIITGLTGGLAAFLSNIDRIHSYLFPKKLELSDIAYYGDTLDFKIRNLSNEVAILKRIEMTISKKWLIYPEQETKGLLLPPNSTYDIILDSSTGPNHVSIKNLSEDLAPNTADRFQVRVGPAQKHLNAGYIFSACLIILYNENEELRYDEDVMFAFLESKDSFIEGNDKNIHKKNVTTMVDVGNYHGIKSSLIQDLIQQYTIHN